MSAHVASLASDALYLYVSLVGLREQCHRFPSTRAVSAGGSHAKQAETRLARSDDVQSHGSCLYLLSEEHFSDLSVSAVRGLLEPELQCSPQLRFILVAAPLISPPPLPLSRFVLSESERPRGAASSPVAHLRQPLRPSGPANRARDR